MIEAVKEKQLPLISLVVPYGFSVALIYLFGYWSTFDIDVLQYVSLADVVKLAIYPLFIGTIATVAGLVAQTLVMGTDTKSLMIVSSRFISWFTFVVIVLAVAILPLYNYSGFALTMAGLLLSVAFLLKMQDFPLLKPLIPNLIIRRVFLFVLVSILLSSFGRGRENGEKVINNKDVKIVRTSIFKGEGTPEFRGKGLLSKHSTLKYLGTAGEYFFFLTPDNEEKVIVKYNDLHFFEYRRQ